MRENKLFTERTGSGFCFKPRISNDGAVLWFKRYFYIERYTYLNVGNFKPIKSNNGLNETSILNKLLGINFRDEVGWKEICVFSSSADMKIFVSKKRERIKRALTHLKKIKSMKT
jgi:hypothetical protein